MAPRSHPRAIVTDGRETGFSFSGPGEQAFRAGVAFTNQFYDSACLIADAFELACTPAYVGRALQAMFPGGWRPVAEEMIKGLVDQLKWVVTGAGIGAMFGLGLGMLLPPAEPFTIAGGAALGAAITQWALVAAGIVVFAKVAIQIGQVSIDLFSAGMKEALSGHKERAATLLGQAIALVVGGVLPIAIVCALSKGAGRMVQSQTSCYMINTLTTKIGATRIASAAEARLVGLHSEEWPALASATRGIFKVFRGCNPSRVEAIERSGGIENVHFKAGYLVDFKSYKKAGRAGEYVIDKSKLQKYLQGHYEMISLGHNKYRLDAMNLNNPKTPYLNATNPIEGGPWLHNHLVEEIIEGGQMKYLVRHVDGKTFVPDIDRLLYAEIGMTGRLGRSGVITGQKWLPNDDPREIMYWNGLISKAISKMTGKPLDWRGFQHGKSADYQKPHKITGEIGPGWPKRNDAGIYQIENEKIVIGVNGNLFCTDWNGLALFCKSLEILNFKYPWAKSVVL